MLKKYPDDDTAHGTMLFEKGFEVFTPGDNRTAFYQMKWRAGHG